MDRPMERLSSVSEMEADGDLDKSGSRRYSGKWSDSGYILTMGKTVFAVGFDVDYQERKVNKWRRLGRRGHFHQRVGYREQ